jgi:hypothetical protein
MLFCSLPGERAAKGWSAQAASGACDVRITSGRSYDVSRGAAKPFGVDWGSVVGINKARAIRAAPGSRRRSDNGVVAIAGPGRGLRWLSPTCEDVHLPSSLQRGVLHPGRGHGRLRFCERSAATSPRSLMPAGIYSRPRDTHDCPRVASHTTSMRSAMRRKKSFDQTSTARRSRRSRSTSVRAWETSSSSAASRRRSTRALRRGVAVVPGLAHPCCKMTRDNYSNPGSSTSPPTNPTLPSSYCGVPPRLYISRLRFM